MHVTATDGTRLYVETAGTAGEPILFVHEFGGNHDAWEPQMQAFARSNRCITYAARGYAPSDIPEDVDRYSRRSPPATRATCWTGWGSTGRMSSACRWAALPRCISA